MSADSADVQLMHRQDPAAESFDFLDGLPGLDGVEVHSWTYGRSILRKIFSIAAKARDESRPLLGLDLYGETAYRVSR